MLGLQHNVPGWGSGVSRLAPQVLERLTLLCGLSLTSKPVLLAPCPLTILLLDSGLCLCLLRTMML